MKRFVFMLITILLFFTAPLMAQEIVGDGSTVTEIDIGSFTGIVALVSAITTQLLKLIPTVSNKTWLQVLLSAAVGILTCFILWLFRIESCPIYNYDWWQTLLYGLFTGLSGCGFYDLIKKVIGNLLTTKET